LKTSKSRIDSILNRPYFYAWGGDKKIYAYTREEWGMGGSNPSGGNYTVRSWVVQLIISVIMIPAALMSFIMLIVAIASLNWIVMIFGLGCTPLFAAAPYVGLKAAQDERKARQARKLRDLPKPQTSVTDDVALNYFEKHPEAGITITKENFPEAQR
jgi:hypothetical protein